jgi:hypothetical protein
MESFPEKQGDWKSCKIYLQFPNDSAMAHKIFIIAEKAAAAKRQKKQIRYFLKAIICKKKQ